MIKQNCTHCQVEYFVWKCVFNLNPHASKARLDCLKSDKGRLCGSCLSQAWWQTVLSINLQSHCESCPSFSRCLTVTKVHLDE